MFLTQGMAWQATLQEETGRNADETHTKERAEKQRLGQNDKRKVKQGILRILSHQSPIEHDFQLLSNI
jgi:hypothetical protein